MTVTALGATWEVKRNGDVESNILKTPALVRKLTVVGCPSGQTK